MKNLSLLFYRVIIFVFAGLSISAVNEANATHFMGSYFHVTQLDSSRHLVFLTIIRDCNGVAFTSGVLHFSSGNEQFDNTVTSQNLISDKDITGLNPDCQASSRCSGGSYIYGFQELVYVDTIDLSGFSNCDWIVSLTTCCRWQKDFSTNPPPHYNYIAFNRCQFNSTPKFKKSPTNLLAYNQDLKISFAAEDLHEVGDSISYELVDPLESINQPLSINFSGYKIPRYLGHPNQSNSLPQGFHLDPMKGMVEFRPIQLNSVSTIVVTVKEWRKINDTMRVISEIRMDNQFVVVNTNYAGHASGINNTPSIQTPHDAYYLCTGDTFRTTIFSSDPDSDSTYLTWDEGIQGATFTPSYGTDSFARGEFAWAPSPSHIRGMPYYVTFTVRDAICPRPATSSKTIAFYVLDSVNAPVIDLGMNITDSTRKDSIRLTPNVSNLNSRPVLWTTTGDGYFVNPHVLNTTYAQGTGDKSNCSYQLKLEITNKNYCYASGGVWEDSLLVIKRYDSLHIQGDTGLFYGDTQTLRLKTAAPVGQDFWWTTTGDGHFDDSTSVTPLYIPGNLDWTRCGGWEIYLHYEKEACAILTDTLSSYRARALSWVQQSQPVLRGDTVFLEAVLDANANTNSRVYWTSKGNGQFGDSTSPKTYYLSGTSDLQNCFYEFEAQDLPLTCLGFSESLTVPIQNPTFEAGANIQLYFGDSAQLSALPLASPNYQFGYWSTAGDGHFMDSNDAETEYVPGTNDWANCGTTVYWNEYDQVCGGRTDSLQILRVNTNIAAGGDQSLFYHPSISYNLQGLSDTANGQLAYWTTSGDGSFNDSFDLNAIYTPGNGDLQNCEATLTLTAYPIGSCTVFDDMQVHIQDSAVKILSAIVDSMAFDTVYVGIYSVANRANLSWTSNGTGSFVSASSSGVAYVLSAADSALTNLELIVQNDAPCLTSWDTLRVNPTLRKVQPPNGLVERKMYYTLYPNPTEGRLHLATRGSEPIRNVGIYDIHGKEMDLTPQLNDAMYTWDVFGLSKGVYVLVVQNNNGIKSAFRFIVK